MDAWETLLRQSKEDDAPPCSHLVEKYSTDVLGLRGQRGVLTGGARPRRPQGRGTRVATRAPGPSQARACRGRPGKPPPLLGRLLRPHARPCSGGPRKPVEQHRGGTGAGSDLPRLRQRLAALAQPPQEPLAWAPYGPPAASEGQPFQPYAFEALPRGRRAEGWRAARAQLVATGVAGRLLGAVVQGPVVQGPVVLTLGGRAPWPAGADEQGGLVTSPRGRPLFLTSSTASSAQHYLEGTTDPSGHPSTRTDAAMVAGAPRPCGAVRPPADRHIPPRGVSGSAPL